MSSNIPVLIAGGGATGHVLALVLLQNAIPVRVVERDHGYRVGQKGAGIQPRTIELHHILGTFEDFDRISGELLPIRMYARGGKTALKETWMAEPVNPTPSKPSPNLRMLGQSDHEAMLRSHIEKLGGKIELSTSIVSFEQSDDHVTVDLLKMTSDGKETKETVKCQYLVGTDGAHSIVRKTAGMTFLGESRPTAKFIFGDIHVKKEMPRDAWHGYGIPGKTETMVLRPIKDTDVWNFIIIGVADKDYTTFTSSRDEVVKGLYAMTGLNEEDIEFGDLVWVGQHSPNIRMVDRFRIGRVFVAGDAAHAHSPTGGQGLNSGFLDGMNLGWKIAQVLKGLSSSTLLDTYNDERLPVIASMLEKTTTLLSKTFSNDATDVEASMKRGVELFQLGVNYRGSKAIVDDSPQAKDPNEVVDPYRSGEDGQVRAGDRAPDAPELVDSQGISFHIFDLFKTTHHTLLIFSSSSSLIQRTLDVLRNLVPSGAQFKKVVVLPKGTEYSEIESVNGVDLILKDSNGHGYAGYNIESKQLPVVIVRPDGWIGATVADEMGTKTYIETIFNTLEI